MNQNQKSKTKIVSMQVLKKSQIARVIEWIHLKKKIPCPQISILLGYKAKLGENSEYHTDYKLIRCFDASY